VTSTLAYIAVVFATTRESSKMSIDLSLRYRLLDRWLPEKTAAGSGGGGDLDETVTNFDFLKNFQKGPASTNGDSSVDQVTMI
jgi:hypothetical protein